MSDVQKGEFVDEAFIGAGAQPGLEIWRIEKLKPVAVDKATYGKFYTGIYFFDNKFIRASRLKFCLKFYQNIFGGRGMKNIRQILWREKYF